VKRYHAQALSANDNNKNEGSFISTPTHEGDAFGKDLTRNRWFGSSVFNLASERLVLG
jgi:hypothetical protein